MMAKHLRIKSVEITEKKLNDHLMRIFHYSSFKNDKQREAVVKILEHKSDVFISFPSGYGRSLCYQLPAVINSNKVTIVFCSQTDRIKKQILTLAPFNIFGITYDPETSIEEQEKKIHDANADISSTYVCLLFVTTEMASTSGFRTFYNHLVKKKRLINVVLDETNYDSLKWLHYIKNNFKSLGILRELHMHIPWIVIINKVCNDVVNNICTLLRLSVSDICRFSIPSFRSNIYYDTVFEESITIDPLQHLKDFIDLCYVKSNRLMQKPCGIIFCKTSEMATKIATYLRNRGVLIAPYHTGLNDNAQLITKREFMNGSLNVITVTGISGMKINKANVNFVIHWGLPFNISDYYHQSGHAGKDGQPAHCRIYLSQKSMLYYNSTNLSKLKCMVRDATTLIQREKATNNLNIFLNTCQMIEYCKTTKCKHSIFAEYFGDLCKQPQCNNKFCKCFIETKFENMILNVNENDEKNSSNKMGQIVNKGVNMYLEDMLKRIRNTAPDYSATDTNQEQFTDILSELSDILELKETESISKRLDLLMDIK